MRSALEREHRASERAMRRCDLRHEEDQFQSFSEKLFLENEN
jgi:hypothetical protein